MIEIITTTTTTITTTTITTATFTTTFNFHKIYQRLLRLLSMIFYLAK